MGPDRGLRRRRDVADDRRVRDGRRRPDRCRGPGRRARRSPWARDGTLQPRGRRRDARTARRSHRRDGYTIARATRSSPTLVDALAADLAATRARSSTSSRRATASRAHHTLRIYNLLAFGELYERDPGARAACCRSSSACSTRAVSISSLSSISILPGETRAADPRRRPAHPVAEAARPDRLQHDVGAHRLHRGERRDPARARARTSPTTRPTTARPTTAIAAEMPTGSVLVWHGSLWHGGGANTHRRAARRHRDELLRGLHPPAGEPAARHPARDGRAASRRGCASSSATASTTG